MQRSISLVEQYVTTKRHDVVNTAVGALHIKPGDKINIFVKQMGAGVTFHLTGHRGASHKGYGRAETVCLNPCGQYRFFGKN